MNILLLVRYISKSAVKLEEHKARFKSFSEQSSNYDTDNPILLLGAICFEGVGVCGRCHKVASAGGKGQRCLVP